MEGDRNTLPSSSALYMEGERGAGGKFRKPPARKKPMGTPYARPPANQSTQRQGTGWLSKLVNPAYRLIAGGATKLLPSYFSKSESVVADLSPSSTSDHDNGATEVTENACKDAADDVKLGISMTIEEAGPSNLVDRLKNNSESNDIERDNMRNMSDDSELAKIEHLVKGKWFSRDELKRLTDILNSKVVDVSDAQRENEPPNFSSWGQAKGALLDHNSPKVSIEMKQEDTNRALLETPTPRVQPNMRDEVAASPVDIARAYMGSRASETGVGSYSIIPKDERAREKSDVFASKPFIPTPSTKLSTCWPGAMIQDQRGYLTPQNERGRYGLHNFPRTPYSRTLHSKSKTKLTELQADSRCLTNSLTPFQRSRNSNYGQVKSRNDVTDGGYGSAGPIRLIRKKIASEASFRGSTSLYSVQNTPSQVEKSSGSGGFLPLSEKNVEPSRMSGALFQGSSSLYSVQNTPSQVEKSGGSGGFLPVSEKNLEPGRMSGTPNYQSADLISLTSEQVAVLPGPSNQTARKIIEQLDRHKPTPKEKAAELKLATAWKRSSEDTGVVPKVGTSMADLAGSALRNKGEIEQKLSVEGNDNSINLKGLPSKTETQNAMAKTSSTVTGDCCVVDDASVGASFCFKNAGDSQIKSTDEKAFVGTKSGEEGTSQLWPLNNGANGNDPTRLPPVASRSDSLKKRSSQPTLKPISFERPDPQRVVSSDNGLGFTFPFSGPASLQSEPPTPSIMPSFMVSGVPQQEGPAIPVFSFGTKKSTSRLVFSFPSTSSSYTESHASDLKFNFGSDKKSRISFGSVGNGALL